MGRTTTKTAQKKKVGSSASTSKNISSGSPLTKDQRYYWSHPEAKEKNRLRMQNKRARERLENATAESPQTEDRPRTYHHAEFFNDQLDLDVAAHATEFGRFYEIREQVIKWCAPWGGVKLWHLNLDNEHHKAREEKQVDKWVAEVLEHASVGRELLHQLSNMQSYLPNTAWKVRELWRLEVDLLQRVIEGLAVIDVRVDLTNASPYSLLAHFDFNAPYRNHSEGDNNNSESEDNGGEEYI